MKARSCAGCGAQVEARRCEYCARLHPDVEIKVPLPTRREAQQMCCGQPMEWLSDALVFNCGLCGARKTLSEVLAGLGQVDRPQQMMNVSGRFAGSGTYLPSSDPFIVWKPDYPARQGVLEALGLGSIFK